MGNFCTLPHNFRNLKLKKKHFYHFPCSRINGNFLHFPQFQKFKIPHFSQKNPCTKPISLAIELRYLHNVLYFSFFISICVCVCVYARACMRVCVCVHFAESYLFNVLGSKVTLNGGCSAFSKPLLKGPIKFL